VSTRKYKRLKLKRSYSVFRFAFLTKLSEFLSKLGDLFRLCFLLLIRRVLITWIVLTCLFLIIFSNLLFFHFFIFIIHICIRCLKFFISCNLFYLALVVLVPKIFLFVLFRFRKIWSSIIWVNLIWIWISIEKILLTAVIFNFHLIILSFVYIFIEILLCFFWFHRRKPRFIALIHILLLLFLSKSRHCFLFICNIILKFVDFLAFGISMSTFSSHLKRPAPQLLAWMGISAYIFLFAIVFTFA